MHTIFSTARGGVGQVGPMHILLMHAVPWNATPAQMGSCLYLLTYGYQVSVFPSSHLIFLVQYTSSGWFSFSLSFPSVKWKYQQFSRHVCRED